MGKLHILEKVKKLNNMINKTEYQDANLFAIGTILDIDDGEDMMGVKLTRINECGVTITGNKHNETVISGKSPARLAIIKPKDDIVSNESVPIKVRKSKVEVNYVFPSEETFTVKQFAELNSIDYPIASSFVKENCDLIELGGFHKGQIGKSPSKYSVKK